MSEILKIEVIKTDIGYFVKGIGWNNYQGTTLIGLLFDGKSPEKTHNDKWVRILDIPKLIEKREPEKLINFRYELIDKSLESDKIPLILKKEEIEIKRDYDNDENEIWIGKYANLRSLYELKSDKEPPTWVPVDFEFKIICELDKIKEYSGFSYPVQKTRWESDGYENLTEKNVSNYEIDTILFPDIILPARTSKLTSEQTYKIIRKHVRDNINPKYAHITSDYDFCFTVKKKIPLAEKIPYRKDISRMNSKHPKYVDCYRENREIEIFEMTHAEYNRGGYQGYTVIKGFEGKNIEDLKQNINKYLKELMEKINEPLEDCIHCKGKGVIVNLGERK